jgi:glycosyltransferase involved in cell wall biosynthesis
MKILAIYPDYKIGGVSAQLRNRLAALGDKADWHLAFFDCRRAIRMFPPGTKMHFLPGPGELIQLLRNENFEVIMVIDAPGAYPAIAAAKTKAFILHEVHSVNWQMQERLRTLTGKPPMGALLVPSQYCRDLLIQEIGFREIPPISFLPYGVDTALFTCEPAPVPPARPIFLWVGRLDEAKNWYDFLAIAREIKHPSVPAEFWMIAGQDAPESVVAQMLSEAAAMGLLDDLRWMQQVDYTALPRIYSLVADSKGAHIITSADEAFGLTAIEAMAGRCPVIFPTTGAMPEIMTGALAEAASPFGNVLQAAALAQRIVADDVWRNRLQEAGAQRVAERYSFDQVGKEYFALLQQFAGARQ